MFTYYLAQFDYNAYYPTDQDVKGWLATINRRSAAYDFGHDCIDRLMEELNVDRPTAVQMFHACIVQMRQQREVRLEALQELFKH